MDSKYSTSQSKRFELLPEYCQSSIRTYHILNAFPVAIDTFCDLYRPRIVSDHTKYPSHDAIVLQAISSFRIMQCSSPFLSSLRDSISEVLASHSGLITYEFVVSLVAFFFASEEVTLTPDAFLPDYISSSSSRTTTKSKFSGSPVFDPQPYSFVPKKAKKVEFFPRPVVDYVARLYSLGGVTKAVSRSISVVDDIKLHFPPPSCDDGRLKVLYLEYLSHVKQFRSTGNITVTKNHIVCKTKFFGPGLHSY